MHLIKSDETLRVRYSIVSRNNETGVIVIKLNFTDTSKVSNGKVISVYLTF